MAKRLLFILFVCFNFNSSTASLADNEPKVIAQPFVPEKKIGTTELVHIFTRKTMFWSDGHKIKVFTKPTDSIEHKLFSISILGLTPYKYRMMLDSVIYSGVNTPVIEVNSDEEMILKVSTTPYSIGYLNYNTIITNMNTDIITIYYE